MESPLVFGPDLDTLSLGSGMNVGQDHEHAWGKSLGGWPFGRTSYLFIS